MNSADVILFVVDIRTGVTANGPGRSFDAADVRQAGGFVCEQMRHGWETSHLNLYEFYNLGMGDPYPVSSVHGHGVGDLLDAVL